MRQRSGLLVRRLLLTSENHGYPALGTEFDDHVRAFVGHPDIVVLIEDLDLDGRRIFGGGKILSERQLTKIRREIFGYIFQNFYLVPTLTVRENVMLPLAFYRKPGTEGEAERLLTMLGMEHRMNHLPAEISGGEMQRVSMARALVNRPKVLIADEPTGSLDTKRTMEIGEILRELNRSVGLTIVMVTHNPDLARLGGRVIEMRDGRANEA